MRVIQDTREQAPFTFAGYACEVVTGVTIPWPGWWTAAPSSARAWTIC